MTSYEEAEILQHSSKFHAELLCRSYLAMHEWHPKGPATSHTHPAESIDLSDHKHHGHGYDGPRRQSTPHSHSHLHSSPAPLHKQIHHIRHVTSQPQRLSRPIARFNTLLSLHHATTLKQPEQRSDMSHPEIVWHLFLHNTNISDLLFASHIDYMLVLTLLQRTNTQAYGGSAT